MKIVVVRSFGQYKAGQEFDWADGMARILIARGLIREADQVELATVAEPAAERAVQQQGKRKYK